MVYADVCQSRGGESIWICFVWAEWAPPDRFWVPSHWFNSATAERKHSDNYTDSELASRVPNSLMPSTKLRSQTLPVFISLVWHGRGLNPGLPHSRGHYLLGYRGGPSLLGVRRQTYQQIVFTNLNAHHIFVDQCTWSEHSHHGL